MPFRFREFQHEVSRIIPTGEKYVHDSYENYNNGYSKNEQDSWAPYYSWESKPDNQPTCGGKVELENYYSTPENGSSISGRFQEEAPVHHDYNWDGNQKHTTGKVDLRNKLNAKRKFSSFKQEDYHQDYYKNGHNRTPIRNVLDENKNVIYNNARQMPCHSQGFVAGHQKRQILYDHYSPKKDPVPSPSHRYEKRKLENDFDNYEEIKRQRRLDRFGNHQDNKTNVDLDLSKPSAVKHSLDEIVKAKNFTYTRNWPKRKYANNFEINGWNSTAQCGIQYSPISQQEKKTTHHRVDLRRPIIIDGSNLAMSYGNNKHYNCKGIQVCVEDLQRRGFSDIIVVVPESRMRGRLTDDLEILRELKNKNMLLTCWAHSYDDRMILEIAHERGGIVVTNDLYRDLKAENPNWSNTINFRRLPFRFMPGRSDYIMFPPYPNGKPLEDFLHFSDTDD